MNHLDVTLGKRLTFKAQTGLAHDKDRRTYIRLNSLFTAEQLGTNAKLLRASRAIGGAPRNNRISDLHRLLQTPDSR
jgi:hypothetical protein